MCSQMEPCFYSNNTECLESKINHFVYPKEMRILRDTSLIIIIITIIIIILLLCTAGVKKSANQYQHYE